MRILVTLMLLTVAFAGCADGEPAKVAEDEGEVVDVDGATIDATKGIVRGKVLNDLGLAIKGARVSILGSDFFGDTNATGHFRFLNVTAGDFELSVQADGFRSFKAPITVVAAQVTTVDVQLAPQTGSGTQHIHDHWQGQTEYLLMDASVDMTQASRGDGAYFLPLAGIVRPITDSSPWPIPIMDTPHGGPAIVLPGTKLMTVTFDSDDTLFTQRQWALRYQHAGQGKAETLPAQTLPATFQLEVDQTMTDSGHQTFSRWDLAAVQGDTVQNGDGGLAQGEMDVTITLTKGELALEPVHEDFWQGADAIVVREKTSFMTGTGGFYTPYALPLDDGKIIPPGTSRLLLELDWTWATHDTLRTALPIEFMYRPASMNVQTWQYDGLIRPTPTSGTLESGSVVYELDLAKEDTDGFYQTRTGWAFFIKVEHHPLYHWEVRPGGIKGDFRVTAIQD